MDAEKLIEQAAEAIRTTITAAEKRAEEIVSEAKEEAKRILAEAEATAQRARTDAEVEAQRRLDEVRTALEALQGRLSGAGGSEIDPGPAIVPEPEPPAPPEPTPDPVPEPMPEPVPEPMPPPDETDRPAAAASGDGSEAAARLVAMKLALDGTSRDDARSQLSVDYDIADLDALLDEVYAKAGR